ncbi:MAG: cell division protein FtsQ/DivIB [Anaerolineae bacterium]
MAKSSRKRRSYDVIITREALGIRQKPRKRKQGFPRVRLLGVPLLVGLAAGLAYLLTAPAYRVHGAAVRGNTLVGAQAIYQMSMVDGQNLFLLNTQASAEAVERVPYVKRAQVRVRPPAQVAIVVEEYQPRWVWVAGDNQLWVDETGNILPYNGPLDGALTVIDLSARSLPIGSSLEPRLVEMMDALSRLMPDVRQATYSENLGFIITVGPRWPVRVGERADGLETRIGVLNTLLKELLEQNRDVDFIDLRYPEQPYYRFK